MIVLDTNVVSEPMKPDGSPAVRQWLDAQAAETLYLTTISLAELPVGLHLLPDGRRRKRLEANLTHLLDTLFGDRILGFDREAAGILAQRVAAARTRGRNLSFADAQIAAIAAAHGFTVATRDTAPFIAAGVPVIDPWRGG